jgi:oligopeptide/dipeptide ABC transporter ATP-binding protein
MRVGQQLTEAMILKTRSSNRNARHNFNSKLKVLNKNCDEGTDDITAKDNEVQIKTFDNLCIQGTKLEQRYNEASSELIGLQFTVENTLFLIEKKQKIDVSKTLKNIKKEIAASFHPFVLVKDSAIEKVLADIDLLFQKRKIKTSELTAMLNDLNGIVSAALKKEKPDFYSLGYFVMCNPDYDIFTVDISKLNKMTKEYLDKNFLNHFIQLAQVGLKNSHDRSLKVKEVILKEGNEFLKLLSAEHLDKKTINEKGRHLSFLVNQAIDRLIIKKNSIEYSFASNLRVVLDTYFNGVHNNPIQQKRYDHEEKKYQASVKRGITPGWKLVPPNLVDLDVAKQNIVKIVSALMKSVESDLNVANFDSGAEVLHLIDYFKGEASKLVAKMTFKMAKAKAIKLLEEVGIPEPRIRFNQYPFEFSGGMRQRIVIAIALSANPDILICDEPTTALDVTIQSQILELIKKLRVERDLSVIFITHNLGVVANMADRVAVMYAGKIVEIGKAEEVFYDPRHPYTWALLGSMPDLKTTGRLEAIPGTPPNMIFPPKGDAFAARNKYAMEIDYEQNPPLFEISDTHFAATWLLHPNAPKIERPRIIQERIDRIKEEVAKNGN